MNAWTWSRNGEVAYCLTADPRVYAIIKVDEDAQSPEAPEDSLTEIEVIACSGWGRADMARTVHSPAIGAALDYFGESLADFDDRSKTARYMRLFYGLVKVYHVESCIDRYANAFVLDFSHEGWGEGWAEEYKNYLDGEVYGIGASVCESDDEHEILDAIDMDCWGYVGEIYAKAEAIEHALYVASRMHPMLPTE